MRDEERRIQRDLRPLGRRAAVRGPRGARADHVRQGRHLPHRRAARSSASTACTSCASASATSSSTTRATASTPISPRCSSSSRCSRRPTASSPAGSRARSRAARTRVSTSPTATTSSWMRHTLAWHDARRGPARLQARHRHPYPARGSELLKAPMEVTLKIRRSPDGASHSLETYTVEVPGDRHAARRARRRQGQARTARSPIASPAGWPSAARAACAWTAAPCSPARPR